LDVEIDEVGIGEMKSNWLADEAGEAIVTK